MQQRLPIQSVSPMQVNATMSQPHIQQPMPVVMQSGGAMQQNTIPLQPSQGQMQQNISIQMGRQPVPPGQMPPPAGQMPQPTAQVSQLAQPGHITQQLQPGQMQMTQISQQHVAQMSQQMPNMLGHQHNPQHVPVQHQINQQTLPPHQVAQQPMGQPQVTQQPLSQPQVAQQQPNYVPAVSKTIVSPQVSQTQTTQSKLSKPAQTGSPDIKPLPKTEGTVVLLLIATDDKYHIKLLN